MTIAETHQVGTNVLPSQDRESGPLPASSDLSSCTASSHAIQLALLEVPGIVIVGDPIEFRVEARCSAGCELAEHAIEIWDHEGAKRASVLLDNTSCAHVKLDAPDFERRFRWTIKFRATDVDELHQEKTCTFAFATTKRPEHVVTVQVTDRDTGAPVENAEVYLRPHLYRGASYSGKTDASGVARIGVPTGDYQIYASAGGKDFLDPAITIESDLCLPVEVGVRERQWWQP